MRFCSPQAGSLSLQQLHQRRGLPHVGEGQLVEGDEGSGVERFGYDSSAGMWASQIRPCCKKQSLLNF